MNPATDPLFDTTQLHPSDPYFVRMREISRIGSTPQTMSRKKKSKRYGCRDSLRTRLKLGSPGSRRFRKHEWEQQLRRTLSESESDLSSDELGFDEAGEPSFGAFASYFYDDAVKKALDPFLNISEQAQREFLFSDSESDEDEADDHFSSSPGSVFYSMSIRNQRALRHCSDPHVAVLDHIVWNFCTNDSRDLALSYASSYARLLLHSIAAFYGLFSFSRRVGHATTKTTFLEKRAGFVVPTATLSDFLVTLS